MTTQVLVGVAVAALLVAVGALVALVRVRARADERVAEAVRRLAAGMEQTMRELAEAHEEPTAAGDEPELATSLDADEVAERVLAATLALPGVEGALLEAAGMSSTLGDAGTDAIRPAVIAPLVAREARVGTLTVFGTPADLDALARLADRAAPALDNARRFAEARRLADVDASTGLRNRRAFHEALYREVARVRRYGRRLTLVLLDLDGLSDDGALAEVAARIRALVRSADVACRIEGDELAVLLPESGRAEGELLAERIRRAVAPMRLAAVVAELRPEDTATVLLERADEALRREKLSSARGTAASP